MPKSKCSALETAILCLLILSCTAVFVAPLFVHYLEADGQLSIHWIDHFTEQYRRGIFWPRWMPHAFAGLGSPTFYFYPPFAFFVTGLCSLLFAHQSAQTLYFIAAYLGTGASILTFFVLSAEFTQERNLRLLSSFFYGLAPYHVFVELKRGGLAEHFGFIWPPIILYCALQLLRQNKVRIKDFVIGSVSFSLLVYSHIPTTLVFGLSILAPLLVLSIRNRRIGWVLGMLASGSLLAAPYILPVLAHTEDVQLRWLCLDPDGTPDALLSFSKFLTKANYTASLNILVGYFGMLLLAIALFLEWKHKRVWIIRLLLVCTIVVLLLNNTTLSRPIWNLFHLNEYIQYPYRWLVTGTLIVSASIALSGSTIHRMRILPTLALWALAGLLFAGLKIADIRGHSVLGFWSPYEPAEYAPATASHDYNSVIAFATAHRNDPFILSNDTALHTKDLAQENLAFRDSIITPHGAIVTLHHWYWPDWKAYIDGREIKQSSDNNGRPMIAVPGGSHLLRYQLETSQSEIIGCWIGCFGVLTLCFTGLVLRRNRSESTAKI